MHNRGSEITIDLEQQTVTAPDGTTHQFDIAASRKRSLLLGLDDVALTLEHKGSNRSFRKRLQDNSALAPWHAARTGRRGRIVAVTTNVPGHNRLGTGTRPFKAPIVATGSAVPADWHP